MLDHSGGNSCTLDPLLLDNDNMTTETQAYLNGNIELADALARIADLEAEVEALENAAADVVTLKSWENSYGPAYEYYQFFNDCFARLDGHYPCTEVTSDYDKSIIFAAIERGAGITE